MIIVRYCQNLSEDFDEVNIFSCFVKILSIIPSRSDWDVIQISIKILFKIWILWISFQIIWQPVLLLYWSLLGPTVLYWSLLVSTQCTHSCSSAAGRCRSNPACSSGRRHPRCGKGSADTRQFGCCKTPGPTCRCCCCTDRADTASPPPRGFHSNQVSTRHSEHLQREGDRDHVWQKVATSFLWK